MELKILELFGGIGAIRKAFERTSVPFKVVDYVDIDKYAVKSYNAIFNENYKPQNICNWNKDIEVDLIMHGSPCQDFSVAGLNQGGDEGTGTRSSLMWETVRIITKLKPKYIIWENVKNVIGKKHKHNFDKYINELDQIGYNSYYQVLNAKDYGIPQNRERVFTISIRKDVDKGFFNFPEKQELKFKLKHLLENEVDEKYYLSDEQVKKIQFQLNDKNTLLIDNSQAKREGKPREYSDIAPTLSARDYKEPRCIQVGQMYGTKVEPNPQAGRIYDSEGVSPTMDSCSGGNRMPKVLIKNNTNKGYLEAEAGDGIYTNITNKRGTVQKGMIPALTSLQDKGVVVGDSILLNYPGTPKNRIKKDIVRCITTQGEQQGVFTE